MIQEMISVLTLLEPAKYVLLITLTTCIYLYITKRKPKRPFKGVPSVPNPHWLLGHVGMLFRNENIDKKYFELFVRHASAKGQCSIWYGSSPALSVTKAADVQHILKCSSTHAVSPILAYHYSKKMGGELPLIHVAQGKVWQTKRRIVHSMFTRNLESNSPIFGEVAVTLAKKIWHDLGDDSSSNIYDIIKLMKLYAFDNYGVLAFGNDLGCCKSLQMNSFTLALDVINDDSAWRLSNILNPTAISYWLPTANNTQRQKAENVVEEYFTRMLHQRRQAGFLAAGKRDLLSLLLDHYGDNSSSRKSVFEMLRTTFYAAFSTTSFSLGAAFWLVASRPHIQTLCLEEINRVLGSGGFNDDQHVNQLVYCRAVLLEALRKYPSGPLVTRILEKDAALGGSTYLAGTKVLIPIWSIHRDPDNFPRPDEFIPERWVKRRDDGVWEERLEGDESHEESGVPPANRNAFVAFSGGGRNCVGQKFALNEGTMVFAALLREIKMEVVSEGDLDVWLSVVTLDIKNGIPLSFKRRRVS